MINGSVPVKSLKRSIPGLSSLSIICSNSEQIVLVYTPYGISVTIKIRSFSSQLITERNLQEDPLPFFKDSFTSSQLRSIPPVAKSGFTIISSSEILGFCKSLIRELFTSVRLN